MSNIVVTAQKYRQKLNIELARVDEFLRFAERMKDFSQSDPILSGRAAAARPEPAAAQAAAETRAPVAAPAPEAAPETIAAGDGAETAPGVAPDAARPHDTSPAPRGSAFRSLFNGLSPADAKERQSA